MCFRREIVGNGMSSHVWGQWQKIFQIWMKSCNATVGEDLPLSREREWLHHKKYSMRSSKSSPSEFLAIDEMCGLLILIFPRGLTSAFDFWLNFGLGLDCWLVGQARWPDCGLEIEIATDHVLMSWSFDYGRQNKNENRRRVSRPCFYHVACTTSSPNSIPVVGITWGQMTCVEEKWHASQTGWQHFWFPARKVRWSTSSMYCYTCVRLTRSLLQGLWCRNKEKSPPNKKRPDIFVSLDAGVPPP